MKKSQFQYTALITVCIVALIAFMGGMYFERNQNAKAFSLAFQKVSTGESLQTGEECFFPKVPSVNGCVDPSDLDGKILNDCILEGKGVYDIRYCRCLAATNNDDNQCTTVGG